VSNLNLSKILIWLPAESVALRRRIQGLAYALGRIAESFDKIELLEQKIAECHDAGVPVILLTNTKPLSSGYKGSALHCVIELSGTLDHQTHSLDATYRWTCLSSMWSDSQIIGFLHQLSLGQNASPAEFFTPQSYFRQFYHIETTVKEQSLALYHLLASLKLSSHRALNHFKLALTQVHCMADSQEAEVSARISCDGKSLTFDWHVYRADWNRNALLHELRACENSIFFISACESSGDCPAQIKIQGSIPLGGGEKRSEAMIVLSNSTEIFKNKDALVWRKTA